MSVQLTPGTLYHPALNNASQARSASWIQQSGDVVEHAHHGPVAVTRRGMPVLCYAGTGRRARRAETGSSLLCAKLGSMSDDFFIVNALVSVPVKKNENCLLRRCVQEYNVVSCF